MHHAVDACNIKHPQQGVHQSSQEPQVILDPRMLNASLTTDEAQRVTFDMYMYLQEYICSSLCYPAAKGKYMRFDWLFEGSRIFIAFILFLEELMSFSSIYLALYVLVALFIRYVVKIRKCKQREGRVQNMKCHSKGR